jgi:hypothetical protein
MQDLEAMALVLQLHRNGVLGRLLLVDASRLIPSG